MAHTERAGLTARAADRIVRQLKDERYVYLTKRRRREKDLRLIAERILRRPEWFDLATALISAVVNRSSAYDWNVGSLVPYWPAERIADIIGALPNASPTRYLASAGLTWALGELGSIDPRVILFLRQAVRNRNTPGDAWRAAAISLNRLGQEQAVELLKSNLRRSYSISYCLQNLEDHRAVIGLLSRIESRHVPEVANALRRLLETGTRRERLSAAWLVGRLRLDSAPLLRLMHQQLRDRDYETRLNTLMALRDLRSSASRGIFEKHLENHGDPLFRREAAHALGLLSAYDSIPLLKRCLAKEREPRVIASISRALDTILDPDARDIAILRRTSDWHENGMIRDESDKWYANPAIYHRFSESQDPNNVLFGLLDDRLRRHPIKNPIDLGCGTGRFAWWLLQNHRIHGRLYCVDRSREMLDFLERRARRQLRAREAMSFVKADFLQLPGRLRVRRSTLLIANFGFPSRVFDKSRAMRELRAIRRIMDTGALLITIGWDESFNDELSQMWYRYTRDKVFAVDFEDWRRQRASAISSPRNCGLHWLARHVRVPVRFPSTLDAAEVMGHLFGRSAGEWTLRENKKSWWMSLGITCDSTRDIDKALVRESR